MESTGSWSHQRWKAKQLQEAEVISGGEQLAIFGERGGVNHAERWPYSLAGGTQNRGPGGPVQLPKLWT